MTSGLAEFFGYLILHSIISLSATYPIYHFLIHETRSGTLLEFSRLDNVSVYSDFSNSTSAIAVILLTNSPAQNFEDLKKFIPSEINIIYDRREFNKLQTPQVHVLVRSTNSRSLPGAVKFMAPLKKMNSTDIAKFITTSLAVEKNILSPNIEKVVCFPDQQVILMNTVLGKYRAFTMYVVNWIKVANSTNLANELDAKQGFTKDKNAEIQLPSAVAKDILDPIRCDMMFGQNVIDIEN
ncbi:unnamed protein product [Gongylonema pulchrum]|uniref:SERPIN domain-containing protein n=1 Tax=Gongylonema pulchrum TaxID=637853 RepID=A0A183CYT6_9BILA|nr:unnamed protein product [Gongylonema pulchrum]